MKRSRPTRPLRYSSRPAPAFAPRTGMVNVRHPRCADPSCKRQPSFGTPGGGGGDGKANGKGKGKGKAVFCVLHKEPEMVDVVNVRKKPKAKK